MFDIRDIVCDKPENSKLVKISKTVERVES